jgi:hypothetical protein
MKSDMKCFDLRTALGGNARPARKRRNVTLKNEDVKGLLKRRNDRYSKMKILRDLTQDESVKRTVKA